MLEEKGGNSMNNYPFYLRIIASFTVLCLLLSFFSLSFTSKASEAPIEQLSYSPAYALHVEGNTIKNAGGSTVRLNGPVSTDYGLIHNTWHSSNFADWYNSESLSTLKSWGCNSLRFAMTVDCYVKNPDTLAEYESYIDLITSCGMYAIIEWGYCGNPLNVESAATIFFDRLSQKYANNPYVLYEICNEPFHATWSQICDYSSRIIPLIRKNAPNSVILVGTPYPSSSQPDTPYTTINSPLNYGNIVYTLHNYAGQNLTYDSLNYIKAFHNANLALDVSEFGTTMATGTDGHHEVPSVIYLKTLDRYNIGWHFFNMSDIHFSQPTYDSSLCKPGMWTNSLTTSSLSDSGLFIRNYITSNGNSFNLSNYCMMMNQRDGYAFWSSPYKEMIKNVIITSSGNRPSSSDISWDVSIDQSGNVIAYLQNDTLYIVPASGPVYAPETSDSLFANMVNVESISFENMDFSNVVTMRSIFRGCKVLNQIDFSNKSFSQLKDATCAFSNCSSLVSISFAECNMPKLASIVRLCEYCSSINQIYVGYVNASGISSVDKTFVGCPQDQLTIHVKNANDAFWLSGLCPSSSVVVY